MTSWAAVGDAGAPEPERTVLVALAIACVVGLSWVIHLAVPAISPVLPAMVFGVLLAPVAQRHAGIPAAIERSGPRAVRVGVALLGLSVSIDDVRSVGWAGVMIALAAVTVTMAGTTVLGRRLGVEPGQAILIAAGTAICGASAIAAMSSAVRSRDEHVGYAIGVVTVLGTVAMFGVPVVAGTLGLTPVATGVWAGASIHEVAQVTVAGAAVSAVALKVAAIEKLCRVVMLAPVTAVAARLGGQTTTGFQLPTFLIWFLVLAGLRSLELVSDDVVHIAAIASATLLAVGLATLGLGLRVAVVRRAGLLPLALAVAASLIVSATSLLLVVVALP